jgi:hypothetical protein
VVVSGRQEAAVTGVIADEPRVFDHVEKHSKLTIGGAAGPPDHVWPAKQFQHIAGKVDPRAVIARRCRAHLRRVEERPAGCRRSGGLCPACGGARWGVGRCRDRPIVDHIRPTGYSRLPPAFSRSFPAPRVTATTSTTPSTARMPLAKIS